ncbi:hypothetical protein EsVE80_11180 [Enterococcus saigonensis]|uniref:Uncharacterized protein n=1 Tax=Enterococcus saigonensis TaxID=1805431 RepID=A0A679IJD9_9ENTE|nr:hypothetical protein EsVE80_11180 [Enterococcus saigonensis]
MKIKKWGTYERTETKSFLKMQSRLWHLKKLIIPVIISIISEKDSELYLYLQGIVKRGAN